MNGLDPQAAEIAELSTDLVVWRDSTRYFRGRLGPSGDDLDGTKHTASFTANDYRGMLARRIIWPGSTVAFSQVEQTTIAWTLINDSQTLGSWGITKGDGVGGTNVKRDRNYDVGSVIGQMLDELGRVDSGYEWEVDANLAFNVWRQRGSPIADPVVYGRDITGVKRTVDTSKFANAVRYSGADGVTPATAVQTPGPEGRWEIQVGDTSLQEAATVAAKATWELAVDAVVTPSYTVTMAPGWWAPTRVWLGDTIRLIVKSGRLNVDITDRVTQIEVDLDDNGKETVTLTIGRPPVTLGTVLTDYRKRLQTIERR